MLTACRCKAAKSGVTAVLAFFSACSDCYIKTLLIVYRNCVKKDFAAKTTSARLAVALKCSVRAVCAACSAADKNDK